MNDNSTFIHHVYFWLKNPDSKTDFGQLVAGLHKLSAVKTIKTFNIGKPADTSRDVIDSSYSISWLLLFNNKADQDSYQTDPIHLKFVDECKHLWKKVVVYDTVNVWKFENVRISNPKEYNVKQKLKIINSNLAVSILTW